MEVKIRCPECKNSMILGLYYQSEYHCCFCKTPILEITKWADCTKQMHEYVKLDEDTDICLHCETKRLRPEITKVNIS